MTTLKSITDAANDAELLERITSAAAEIGITNAEGWARAHARRIVVEPVNGGSDNLASVYAYAVATYVKALTPGANPAAVTDEYIRLAVASARATIEGPA